MDIIFLFSKYFTNMMITNLPMCAENYSSILVHVCTLYSLPFVALSPAQTLQVIYLRLTYDWTFELLAMACDTSFDRLNILLAIL